MKLDGAVILITGAGTGVGAAAAKLMSARGARVVVNYSRSKQQAEEVVELCLSGGGEAISLQGDVSDDSDCRKLIDKTMSKWGKINGLLNNAGTTKLVTTNDLDELSADDFISIYRVNVVGAYMMTQAAAPVIKDGGGGSIVMTSSIAGVMGVGSSIAYAASKGALNTMTLALARILAPEIRVNAVAPGFITGRWWQEKLGDEKYQEMVKGVEKSTPLERAGTPEDMAEAAIWLMSAANVTGEIIISDAGMHLGGAPLVAR